jgi:hypothetical protein
MPVMSHVRHESLAVAGSTMKSASFTGGSSSCWPPFEPAGERGAKNQRFNIPFPKSALPPLAQNV